jgi:hypothetical protein
MIGKRKKNPSVARNAKRPTGIGGRRDTVKTLLAVLLLSALSFGQTSTQDAGALEARYGTCDKHHIPSDKCTVDIYRQLVKKDNAAKAAKEKRDLFLLEVKNELTTLHSCTQFEDLDAGGSVTAEGPWLTKEALKKCSDAAEWLTKNGLADSVKREAELSKKQACERGGHGAWIVPSAACGKSCGSEPIPWRRRHV